MSLHAIAYYDKSSPTDKDIDLPAVPDEATTTSNGHFVLNRPMSVVAGYAASEDIDGLAFINAPSLFVSPLAMFPLGSDAAPVFPPHLPNILDLRSNPTMLQPQEEISVTLPRKTAGVSKVSLAVVFLQDQFEPIPAGDSFWFFGSDENTTPPEGKWTQLDLEWLRTLPSGEYAIVGAVASGDKAIAARLILQDQAHRPGMLAMQKMDDHTADVFVDGSLGVLGKFPAWAPPRVEVLSGAAAGQGVVVALRIVRLSGSNRTK